MVAVAAAASKICNLQSNALSEGNNELSPEATQPGPNVWCICLLRRGQRHDQRLQDRLREIVHPFHQIVQRDAVSKFAKKKEIKERKPKKKEFGPIG